MIYKRKIDQQLRIPDRFCRHNYSGSQPRLADSVVLRRNDLAISNEEHVCHVTSGNHRRQLRYCTSNEDMNYMVYPLILKNT